MECVKYIYSIFVKYCLVNVVQKSIQLLNFHLRLSVEWFVELLCCKIVWSFFKSAGIILQPICSRNVVMLTDDGRTKCDIQSSN